jgi:branched-chain amino acid aminotransferase
MAYVCFNGQFLEETELRFSDFSRLRYADSIFESMLWYKDRIPLADYHLPRLLRAANYIGLFFPDIHIGSVVEKLSEINGYPKEMLRVRMTVFRNFGKLYTPYGDMSSYLLECEPVTSGLFNTIEKLGVYTENRKPADKLGNLKSGNSLIYVLARQFATSNFYDDVVVLNHLNNVVEATSSNIYMVKNGAVYTPPLSSGCVDGVMRSYLLDQYEIYEEDFTVDDLKQADELFLSNAISLIQPILTMPGVTYGTGFSEELISFTMQNLLHEG